MGFAGAAVLFLLPLIGWASIVFYRSKIELNAIYSSPGNIRLLYFPRVPLWAWFIFGPLFAIYVLPYVDLLFGKKEINPAAGAPAAFLFLIFGLAAYQQSKKYKRTGGYQGEARWARWGEIITSSSYRHVLPLWVSYNGTPRRWRLWERYLGTVGLQVLAQPDGDSVCVHYLLLGASGSGKGASIFSHVMATSTVPVIYQDEKAECPMIDTDKWRGAIRWGCAAEGGWPSMRWNPIEECRRDPDPLNAFLNLAAVLVPDEEGDNAWLPKLARPILAEMLLSGRWHTLGDFADEIKGRAFSDIVSGIGMGGGLEAGMQGKNVKEYLFTTLYSNLEAYRIGWGREVTSTHDFTLDQLIEKGGYVLGAETEEQRRTPIKLMWTLLLRRLMRSTQPKPCTLIMDEAKKAGKIPHFADALVTLRSRGVCIWSAWQSESLLLATYGKDEGRAILDNFGNRVYLLNKINPTDAESISKVVGNWSKRRGGTVGLSVGMKPSVNINSGSDDETAVPLITKTEILARSRNNDERWAIISAQGGTKQGHLIIAQLKAGASWTRTPTSEEVARERNRIYGAPQSAPVPYGMGQTRCQYCQTLHNPSDNHCPSCGAAA